MVMRGFLNRYREIGEARLVVGIVQASNLRQLKADLVLTTGWKPTVAKTY
jgi:hypothetical protein